MAIVAPSLATAYLGGRRLAPGKPAVVGADLGGERAGAERGRKVARSSLQAVRQSIRMPPCATILDAVTPHTDGKPAQDRRVQARAA